MKAAERKQRIAALRDCQWCGRSGWLIAMRKTDLADVAFACNSCDAAEARGLRTSFWDTSRFGDTHVRLVNTARMMRLVAALKNAPDPETKEKLFTELQSC